MQVKKKLTAIFIATLVLMPLEARALLTIHDFEPTDPGQSLTAKAAVVLDQVTGEVLYSNNPQTPWIPASLTKLVTALVVLDTNPNWNNICTVAASDEVGGARLYTYTGAKYRLQDLFYASLVASANNATNTLARCTGLSMPEFVARMNAKAAQFGATSTFFVEPTGMDIGNVTTASDFAKIANAAFSTERVRIATQRTTHYFTTKGSRPYRAHNLVSTNLLLKDPSVHVNGGKTGYLDESQYNFAGSFITPEGKYAITVLLGAPEKPLSFAETKQLLQFAQTKWQWRQLAQSFGSGAVLGVGQ